MTWEKVKEPKTDLQPPTRQEADPINPQHYKGGFQTRQMECIDLVRELPFSEGNAVKYIWRAGRKGDAKEDLEKAMWYIEDCMMYPRMTTEQRAKAEILLKLIEDSCSYRLKIIKRIIQGQYHEAFLHIDEWKRNLEA